ncbi:MAG: hypothetical protein AAF385_17940, partial [Pseudomonadota bacterium]
MAQTLASIHPEIHLLHAEHVHFADLSSALSESRMQVLAQLLEYGPQLAKMPEDRLASATLRLVVPLPGTISPWSSKA